MAKKPLSEAQQEALARGRAKRDANRNQNKNPQSQNEPSNQEPAQAVTTAPQLITLTPEQLDQLVNRLSGGRVDHAPAPSMTPGVGLQTNMQGMVVGVRQKYDPDPKLYPNPIERLLDDFESSPRTRRLGLRDNYFLTWDITSKPYETKFGYSVVEPTFHMTLYANDYDEEGDETGRAIVIQTLHFNEDEPTAIKFAEEQGLDTTPDTMKQIMDMARYERAKRWLLDVFFPPRNFDMNTDAREEAIGGQVVKVVTKSNVKGFGNPTPKIADEELS